MGSEKAIKKTIDYAKGYGYKLSENEIFNRLISKMIFSREEIAKGIRTMKLKLVNKNKRKKRKMMMAKKLARMIGDNNENILMIGLTGSVAAEGEKKGDDIDLMVVTKKNRLWWCRLWLEWILRKNKISHRRRGEKERGGFFCFNMWMEEGALELPRKKQGLRSAVDLVLLKPLFEREGIYKKFIEANGWAKRWAATPYGNLRFKIFNSKLREKKGRVWGTVVNLVVFLIQYLYMRPKMRKEIVDRKRAFFHGS